MELLLMMVVNICPHLYLVIHQVRLVVVVTGKSMMLIIGVHCGGVPQAHDDCRDHSSQCHGVQESQG